MAVITWKDGGTVTISAAGKRLEGVCYGKSPAEAPTIVMLHEGLGCVALWQDFPPKLADATDFGVFAYSRAGYGQSDLVDLPRPLDYMSREALESLPEVLDAIGFHRGILLGHSDGASIASIYAGSVEDFRVRGLVLIAPHFFTEPAGLKSIAAARRNYESGDLRQKLARHHRDANIAFHGWNDAWLDPGFVEWDITEMIDYWRIPVLAVQGTKDEYGTLAQVSEIETRSYAPVDVAIIKECGHSPHLERPEDALAAISGFVARLERIEHATVEIV